MQVRSFDEFIMRLVEVKAIINTYLRVATDMIATDGATAELSSRGMCGPEGTKCAKHELKVDGRLSKCHLYIGSACHFGNFDDADSQPIREQQLDFTIGDIAHSIWTSYTHSVWRNKVYRERLRTRPSRAQSWARRAGHMCPPGPSTPTTLSVPLRSSTTFHACTADLALAFSSSLTQTHTSNE